MKGNVERLNGDPGAFDRISLNLSALDNPEQAAAAREALENDFMAMTEARFAELSGEEGAPAGFGASEITGGTAADIPSGETGGIGGDLGAGGDTGGRDGDSGDTGGETGNDDDE